MAKLTVSINVDDSELDKAIQFVYSGAKEDGVLEMVKQDYFSKPIEIDMTKIESQEERNYHTNGLVAILVSLQT